MNIGIDEAIACGLIERRFGGWGCYHFSHPDFAALCGLAGEQNRREAETRRLAKEARIAAEYEEERRWQALPKTYIRFGRLPKCGKSYNHRDGYEEQGVSCYLAGKLPDGGFKIKSTLSFLMSGPGLLDLPAYELKGHLCDEVGSDGETLLCVTKRKRIKGKSLYLPIIGEVIAK